MKNVLVFCGILLSLIRSTQAQQAEVLYKTYCGGCHGGNLEGNSAPALIKTKWVHGAGRSSIFRNIKAGIPHTEMVGWSNVLKDNQIKALVDFIKGSQNRPGKTRDTIPAR